MPTTFFIFLLFIACLTRSAFSQDDSLEEDFELLLSLVSNPQKAALASLEEDTSIPREQKSTEFHAFVSSLPPSVQAEYYNEQRHRSTTTTIPYQYVVFNPNSISPVVWNAWIRILQIQNDDTISQREATRREKAIAASLSDIQRAQLQRLEMRNRDVYDNVEEADQT